MDGKITPQDINIIDRGFENCEQFLENASKFIANRTGYNQELLLAGFKEREAESNTAIGDGFAIPHAVLDGIPDSKVFLHIIDQGINYEAFDDQLVNVAFSLVIAKENHNDAHLRQLSSIAISLMDENNQYVLKHEKDLDVLCDLVNRMGEKL